MCAFYVGESLLLVFKGHVARATFAVYTVGLYGGGEGRQFHVEDLWLVEGTRTGRRQEGPEPVICSRVQDHGPLESEGNEPMRVDLPAHMCEADQWYTISLRMLSLNGNHTSFSGTGGRMRHAVESVFSSAKVNFEVRSVPVMSSGVF